MSEGEICRKNGCEERAVQEIKAGDKSGWYCGAHSILAMMLEGEPGKHEP